MRRLALMLLLVAGTAHAQQPPQFFIERIEVRGAERVSPDVVISESLLRTGRTYSEEDLRHASDRVNRLPFLLSADFALEKGSDRGRYVLVISVNETKVFFAYIDLRPYLTRNQSTDVEYAGPVDSPDSRLAVGWRFFVGRRGAIHFGLTGSEDNRDYTFGYSAAAVGYTRYDLFGTRAFATLNLKRPLGEYEGAGSVTPELIVGIPLSVNETLSLRYDRVNLRSRGRVRDLPDFRGGRSQSLFSATWSHNTTNRPFLPTRGSLVSVRPLAVWDHSSWVIYAVPGGTVTARPERTRTRSIGMEAGAARYWELSDRNSVAALLEGGWVRSHERGTRGNLAFDSKSAVITGRFSHSLWDSSRIAKDGDSRVEAELRLGTRSAEYPSTLTPTVVTSIYNGDNSQGSVSWVRRNAWGTYRFGLGYAW